MALRGWSHQWHAEQTAASDQEGPDTPGYASYEDFPYKQPYTPPYSADDGGSSPHHPHHHHYLAPQGSKRAAAAAAGAVGAAAAGSLLRSTSSVLKRVPGAQRVSLVNAYMLGGCGVAAAAAAWLGGVVLLVVLLARLYLPAYEYHHSLPLFFDYSVGPSAAGAYVPLLRQTPVTALLTPPAPHPTSTSAAMAAAAAAGGVSFQGMLTPGSTFSIGGGGSGGGGGSSSGFFPNVGQGGFLGLGWSPASRRASSSSSSSAGGVDVGSGVIVPERDWMVPLHGRLRLAVELEMPAWPEADLVQVTSELVSQQGIILARSARTWIPELSPLLIRLGRLVILGPWQALGLVSTNTRVELPMFDGFQNPMSPPGGWGSVKHLLNPSGEAAAGGSQGSAAAAGGGGAAGVSSGSTTSSKDLYIAGPRAMWLRVTVIGRSQGFGPPRIYRAAAKVTLHVGFFDWLGAAVRPSLPTLLLLISVCIGTAIGGSILAVLLLVLSYYAYSWSNSIEPEEVFTLDSFLETVFGGSSSDALLEGQAHRQDWMMQQQQQHWGKGGVLYEGEGSSSAGGSSPRGALAGSPRADSSFEMMGGRDPELSRFAREEMATRGLSPASAADPFEAAAEGDYDDDHDVMQLQQRQAAAGIELQPLQQQYAAGGMGQHYTTAGSTSSSSLASGAVTAIRRMFGGSSKGGPDSVSSYSGAAPGGSVRRGWGQESDLGVSHAAGGGGRGDEDLDEEQEELLLHDSGVPAHTGPEREWQEELMRYSEEQEDEQTLLQQQHQQGEGLSELSHGDEEGESSSRHGGVSSSAAAAAGSATPGGTGGRTSKRLGFPFKM